MKDSARGRVEEYPFAREAIREAVYNAIAHNCYMYGTPIQIRVMDDAITISNSCILPEGWTVDTLMEPHESKPYNPEIARVFYRAGFIENWGQGIQKICDECKGIGAELPVYELTGTTLSIDLDYQFFHAYLQPELSEYDASRTERR